MRLTREENARLYITFLEFIRDLDHHPKIPEIVEGMQINRSKAHHWTRVAWDDCLIERRLIPAASTGCYVFSITERGREYIEKANEIAAI